MRFELDFFVVLLKSMHHSRWIYLSSLLLVNCRPVELPSLLLAAFISWIVLSSKYSLWVILDKICYDWTGQKPRVWIKYRKLKDLILSRQMRQHLQKMVSGITVLNVTVCVLHAFLSYSFETPPLQSLYAQKLPSILEEAGNETVCLNIFVFRLSLCHKNTTNPHKMFSPISSGKLRRLSV